MCAICTIIDISTWKEQFCWSI